MSPWTSPPPSSPAPARNALSLHQGSPPFHGVLNAARTLGRADDVRVTINVMAAGAGVAFREVMKGGFALAATDPVAGGQAGTRAGSFLTLHLTAIIPDSAEFARDRSHEGELRGSISFAPLGADMPIVHGRFQLFVPTSDPDLKQMVYRAAFEHAGAPYCLKGIKQVRRRSIVHSWTDTTTLYCTLHGGADTSAPVIAAGVLRLGAFDFGRQLASFRTVNAPSLSHKARALSDFFAFFSRELLDTYVWGARRARSRPTDVSR